MKCTLVELPNCLVYMMSLASVCNTNDVVGGNANSKDMVEAGRAKADLP